MIKTNTDFLNERLEERRENGLMRNLVDKGHLVDFCSNDYLGMAQSEAFKQLIDQKLAQYSPARVGATGSRLISGNFAYTEELEQKMAVFHGAETGLIFNSGYDANLGVFASLARRGDTMITDELIHASIIDGVRLTHAKRLRFRHNNLADLEKKLRVAEGNIFVGVESVYSMDGDIAPLAEIADLCDQYNAHLIVDEAHATGVFGAQGEGLVQSEGLQNKVLARIHTFGKALGSHGAVVLGSKALRDYLVNFARSFVYTTALPMHSLIAMEASYELFPTLHQARTHLSNLIRVFQNTMRKTAHYEVLPSPSPIQGVIVPGNAKAKALSQQIEEAGFYVKAILSPTVPAGQERLRICLHAFNTETELDQLIKIINV
ncbi:MAG TPA: 8-amino-7-oxononanoate synthase [Microscillaceae bacterium]|nr:8-amino-7-oxononanoate synthase [Microscillaceae bacterium]